MLERSSLTYCVKLPCLRNKEVYLYSTNTLKPLGGKKPIKSLFFCLNLNQPHFYCQSVLDESQVSMFN